LTTKTNNKQFNWTADYEHAFTILKSCLRNSPVLVHPKFDRENLLQTDASDIGLGAILSQLDDNGVEGPIAYVSKILSGRERNYCTTEKEAFAVIFGILTFRTYLLCRPFQSINQSIKLFKHGKTFSITYDRNNNET
jgi:phospholipid-translocating ATPase